MKTQNPARHLLATALLFALTAHSHGQGTSAAVVQSQTGQGPRLLVAQTTARGIRWTSLDSGRWTAWKDAPCQLSLIDAGASPALAGWRESDGWAHFNLFIEAAGQTQRTTVVQEVRWDFGNTASGQDIVNCEVKRTRDTDDARGFRPLSALGWPTSNSFGIFGSSVHRVDPTTLRYRPREFTRIGNVLGNPSSFRDPVSSRWSGANRIDFSRNPAVVWESGFNFERFMAFVQERNGLRVTMLYFPSSSSPSTDLEIPLGAPSGCVSLDAPHLLTHNGPNQSPLNVFVVAGMPNGERHLMERFAPAGPTIPASWGPWTDHGRPPGALQGADNFQINAAVVWREHPSQTLRVNLFGTRGGQLIDYWWNGGTWQWGTALPFPNDMGSGCKIVDAAAIMVPNEQPRISVFALDSQDRLWERVWDWAGWRWNWRMIP